MGGKGGKKEEEKEKKEKKRARMSKKMVWTESKGNDRTRNARWIEISLMMNCKSHE